MKHKNIPQLLMSTRGHTKNILKFIMKILELHTVKPALVTGTDAKGGGHIV
jgi:hypothetical protein